MAVAAEALLKLRAVFDGEGFDRAARAIDGIENTARRSKRNFKNVLNSDAWQGAAVGATGIAAGLIYSAKKAIELDTQMAQVRKVVDFKTPQGLINMRRGLVDLSREIPYTAKELAEIAASGGMAGFTEKEIPKFVKAAATMGTAFNIPAKEAGDAMVAMQAGMGLTLDGAVDLGDAINHLSDNMKGVVEPAALVDVVKRVGAVGKASGLSAENVAALGAAFLAPGTNADVAATGMKNFLNALTKGDAGSAPFRKAMDDLMGYPGAAKRVARDMQTDAVGTIKTVLERIAALPKDIQPQMVSQIFGEESKAAIMPLLTNTKLLSEAFGMVGTKSKYAGSMQKEFANQMNTTESQLKLFKNNVDALAIELGQALLPGINAVLMGLRPFVSALIFATQKVPGLSTAIVALGVAFAGLVISAPFIAGLITIANAARGLWASGTAARALGTALSTVLRGSAGGGAGFFAGLINAAKAVPGLVMGALRVLPGMVAGLFRGLGGAMGLGNIAQGLKTFLTTLRGFTPTMVMQGGQWVVPWTVRLATALRSILPVMALVGRAVAGVFSGPVGWVALLITAGVALFTFRNQIGQFAATVAPALSNAFAPLRQLFTNLGALLAPAWASIAAAFRTYVVQPIQAVWNFLVVWIGQTVAAYAIVWWQGVVSGFNLYVVQPIQAAWGFLMAALRVGVQGLAVIWAGIAQAFYTYVVVPVQTAWNQLTMTLEQGVAYLRSMLSQAWQGVSQAFTQWVVQPISQAWQGLVGLFMATTAPARNALSSAWQGVAQGFNTYVVQPVSQAWNGLTGFISGTARNMVQGFTSAWSAVANGVQNNVIVPLQNMFSNLASRIRATFDGLLGWARNIGNFIVDRVNPVRQAAGFQPLQRFARGGYVNGPTLGLIGEGRDPREYIIPERKMAGAAMNYLNGKRGASVLKGANNIRGFASGGFVKSGSTTIGGKTVSWDDPDAADKILALYRAAGIPDNQIRFSISKPVDWTKKRDNVGRTTINGKTVRWDEKDAGRKIAALYQAAGISDNQINLTMTAARGPVTSSRRKMRSNNQPARQQYQRNWATEPRMSSAARISRGLSGVLPDAVLGSTRSSGWHGGLTNPDNWWKSWGGRPKYGRRNKDETNLFGNNRAERKQSRIAEDRLTRLRQSQADWTIENLRKIPGLSSQELALLESSALKSMGYATGGYVKKPTLAWVGEGRDSEYILPQSKMYDASMAYLTGARGMGVVNPPKFASGGVVGRSTPNRAANLDSLLERSSGLGGGSVVVEPAAINATIEVRTGDVLQFEGQQYVTLNDYQRGLRQVQDKTLALMRSAQGRRATGR